jgi:hypothetical protein
MLLAGGLPTRMDSDSNLIFALAKCLSCIWERGGHDFEPGKSPVSKLGLVVSDKSPTTISPLTAPPPSAALGWCFDLLLRRSALIMFWRRWSFIDEALGVIYKWLSVNCVDVRCNMLRK